MGEAKRRKQTGAPSPHRSGIRVAIIGSVVVIAIAVVVGLYLLTAAPQPTSDDLPTAAPDAQPFPSHLDEYGVSVGDENAPVVVREFADYQCPACARFSEATQRLKQEYVESGQVRFVYFDLPLQQHQNAMPAALAARCAGVQDAYWQMHDKLFASQTEWSGSNDPEATFTRYAGDLGLNERRFQNCMESQLYREDVEQSRQVAVQMRAMGTPTVYVDNIKLTRPGWGQLSAVVERELNAGDN
ncbi:DsbA family protein [Marinobacter pelagius]|uniref:DsbA family protein n=1 Tax=Marinobacter sp. C7 TaxID=2951363 RepID=UPI001EF15FF9|nr:thioredoxin domain-containing protein [Marinobacter sp. C7]MCG7198676.1 DsbA family protein [Marinobacter sp. C7]